jgi:hypothetical protein
MRWLWVVLVACDSGSAAPPAPPPAPPEPAAPAAPAPAAPATQTGGGGAPAPAPVPTQRGNMHSHWSHIVTVDDCWYFSGPEGRDNRLAGDVELERSGDKIHMQWGNASFDGTFKAGELDLERTTTHEFGDPWSATEHIHGKYIEGAIHAKYTYKECERGTACPNKCSIDAELDLSR